MTSTASSPSLAVIGCGAIAEQFYAPALAKLRSRIGNLIFVDLSEARAKQLAALVPDAEVATDIAEVANQVQGAINATPHHLHQRLNLQLLDAGVAVLCEKPVSETGEQLRELLAAMERAGAPVLVNNTRRLLPSYAEVRKILASGDLGEPQRIFFHEGGEFSWPSVSGFYFDAGISPKGVLLDRGAHVLDLACWWLDGKPQLQRFQDDSFGGPEAVCQVDAQLGPCAVDIRLSWLTKLANRFEVRCERGTIEGDIYDFFGVIVTRQGGSPKRMQLPSPQSAFMEFGLPLVDNFLDVLAGKATPLVAAADVQPSIDLMDECYARRERFELPWYQLEPPQEQSA